MGCPNSESGTIPAEAPTDPPEVSAQGSRSAGGSDSKVSDWARTFFSHPNRVVTVFWAAGGVAAATVVPLERWRGSELISLLSVAVLCGAICAVRALAGERLPRWVLHLDLAAGTVLASALAAIGASGHIAFADLYIWIGVFAVLYFRLPTVLSHVAAAGAAYAVVLAAGPRVPQPVAAWLAVFGTLAVAAGVTFLLVSVLRATAKEDPLTGLANRRAFDERLEDELQRSQRAGTSLSVVMSDLDGFKTVNDLGGHAAGDELLRELAAAWRVRSVAVGTSSLVWVATSSPCSARELTRWVCTASPGGLARRSQKVSRRHLAWRRGTVRRRVPTCCDGPTRPCTRPSARSEDAWEAPVAPERESRAKTEAPSRPHPQDSLSANADMVVSRRRARSDHAFDAGGLSEHELLKAVVNGSPIALTVVDLAGLGLLWNRAAERVFGGSAKEVIGHRLPTVDPAFEEEFEGIMARTLGGASVVEHETRRRHRDAHLIDVAISTAPIHDRRE